MSNGPEVDNTTNTITRPPQFLEPGIANAAYGAASVFNGGPESYVSNQGRNLVGQTLRGDFLLPGTNPYLQSTFDRAANTVQNRLDTQFAGAGRNIGASLPAARQELSDLATGIFGGNFQAERDRQMQTLGMSSSFDPLNQYIQRLGLLGPIAGRTSNQTSNTEESPGALDTILNVGDWFF